jgi:hypothetical protein
VVVALVMAGCPGGGRPGGGAAVIPSPARGGMMGFAVLLVGGTNQRRDRANGWGS